MRNSGIIFRLLFIISLFTFFNCKEKEKENPKYYRIGSINKEIATRVDNFEICGERIIGFYHSSAPEIYNGDKNNFRKRLLESYDNNRYSDSGYLNLRFYINCKGDVGYLEVNELDLNLEKTNLDESMVRNLVDLVVLRDNWNPFYNEEANYYMYLNFRIENGEITEILP